MFAPNHQLLCLFFVFVSSSLLPAQDERSAGVTVKGRLVQNENQELEIKLDDLRPMLVQQVVLPTPPVPRNWNEMTQAQRRQWIEDFEQSTSGKALIAERKKRADAALRFELQLEPDGTFAVYDVPAGNFGLRGRMEKSIENKSYVFEVNGIIEVGEKVDEILLDPIMVTATRLLKAGERVPSIDVAAVDRKERITNKRIEGQQVLISFWSMNSPPSLEFSKTVQQTYQELEQSHDLKLISICIDSPREQAREHIVKSRAKGDHGYAKTWNHELLREFGVRSIPALFLIGKDGVVRMTHSDFQKAFQTERELKDIIVEGLSK